MQYLWYYLILINAISFLLMRIDKEKARRRRWRIPEATLLTAVALGGSLGALAGMFLFHHKTRHKKFTITVPLLLLLQAGLLLWIIR